jgi:hypothetical protein
MQKLTDIEVQKLTDIDMQKLKDIEMQKLTVIRYEYFLLGCVTVPVCHIQLRLLCVLLTVVISESSVSKLTISKCVEI